MKRFYLMMVMVLMGLSIRLQSQSDSMMVMPPIETDRPGKSEGAALVPKGYLQMEFGFSIEDTDPGFIYSYPSSLWRFGVTDNFELSLVADYITIQHEGEADLNGFLPLSLGIKSGLTKQKGVLPKISFIGRMQFPGVVSEELETTYLAPTLLLAFSHNVSDFFALTYNAGVEWDGEHAEPYVLYSLRPSFNIADRLGIYLEGYGRTPQRESGPIEFRADAGLTYLIGNNFLVDVSAGKGISEDAPESYVEAGFSYRFKL